MIIEARLYAGMCNTHLHPSITYDLYLRLAVAMVVFRGDESSDRTVTLLSRPRDLQHRAQL